MKTNRENPTPALRHDASTILQHSKVSDGFWAEALLTVVHIINVSLTRSLGYKIPQELQSGKTPDYGKLQIFGCEVSRAKLD